MVVLAVDAGRITSGVRVLLGESTVVKNSSSSSFIRTLGSYSVVSMEKSPEPEPLPTSISSVNRNYYYFLPKILFAYKYPQKVEQLHEDPIKNTAKYPPCKKYFTLTIGALFFFFGYRAQFPKLW